MNNKSIDKKMGFVCAYFNPCRFEARFENYMVFKERFAESGITLITVEAAIGGQDFELEETDSVIRRRSDSLIWHKEALLNIGIQQLLESGYENVGWIDADVAFLNDDWATNVREGLESATLLQCFSKAVMSYTDRSYWAKGSAAEIIQTGTSTTPATGGAWIAHRKLLTPSLLFPFCIVGSFDMALIGGLVGGLHNSFLGYGDGFRRELSRWVESFSGMSQLGYAENDLVFMSHGKLEDRKYSKRHDLVSGFDPEIHLKKNQDKLYEWVTGCSYVQPVKNYFV
jgi:hypothetical protein